MISKDKKKKLFKLVLKVLGLFLIIEVFCQVFAGIFSIGLYNSIRYGKYGMYLVTEAVVVIFAIIFLIIRKKSNVLKRKRLNFFESIKLGLPILILSVMMFIINVKDIGVNFNIYNLISVVFYAVFIGIFEEIVFRGIILNELLEKNSSTKKEVFTSIIISALFFGITHLTNLLAGQDILTTLMQVIQTSAIGFLLGSMYYVSDNIYSVIFLHGFYDLSVLLSDVNLIKDCTFVSKMPLSYTLQSLIASTILSVIYILYSLLILKQSNINLVMKKKISDDNKVLEYKRNNKIINLIWFSLGAFLIFNFSSSLIFKNNSEDYRVCYNYETKKIKRIETHYYNYNDFTIYLDDTNLNVYLKKNKAYINNFVTNEKVKLDIKDVLKFVSFDNQLVILANVNNNYKIYYTSINDGNLNDINKSFKVLDVPRIVSMGYLIDADTLEKYPLLKSDIDDLFIIEDNNVYQIK